MSGKKLSEHLQKMQELWVKPGKWPFYGVGSGFPVLDERVSDFRDGLYLFAGGAGVGKTTFLTQLVFQMLVKNPQMYGFFLSLDMSYLDIVARFLSLASRLPVEKVRNPTNSQTAEEREKRENGIRLLEELQYRLEIADQSHECFNLESIEQEVARMRENAGDGIPLVIGIDPVLGISTPGIVSYREKSELISEKLKVIARKYGAGIVMSAQADNAARRERPQLRDVENYTGLIYGSDMIGLLYNDSLNSYDTPFMEWEWGTEDLMVPIVELNIVKNKHHSKLGRVFYRFFNSVTRYRECAEAEVDHYNDMLGNLEYYNTDPRVKGKKNLQKKIYVAPE
jgi:replicative DNA helicase